MDTGEDTAVALRDGARRFARGTKERLQAFAAVNGVLAGFALASAIQLASAPERGWASLTTMALLFGSAGLLLGSTMTCYLLVARAANLEAVAEDQNCPIYHLDDEISVIQSVVARPSVWRLGWSGFLLLILGSGFAGWIVSPIVGAASSLSSVIGLVVASRRFASASASR